MTRGRHLSVAALGKVLCFALALYVGVAGQSHQVADHNFVAHLSADAYLVRTVAAPDILRTLLAAR